MMKKFYLIAAMMLTTVAVNAQQRLNLSTYAGTNLTKYADTECVVNANRFVCTGWNTLSLPFAVTEAELNEVFGTDCRLERLVGAELEGSGITLNFMDCKAEGIQPNVPYILYYSGEAANKQLTKTALVKAGESVVSFNAGSVTVTMFGANTKRESKGLYGILARDNAEAKFVSADDIPTGFYATRCGISLSNGTSTPLTARHLKAGEVTSITAIAGTNERVDVYNLAGQRVAGNIRVADMNNLPAAIYVVKGQKVMVK